MDKTDCSTELRKAKQRFEYWYGLEAAKMLYAEIANLPVERQVEMIYREMEYRENLAVMVEQNQIQEELCELGGWR